MGGILLLIGVAVLGFGLMQHFKGKRILAAPFKKTGELSKNPSSPDPKGAMSTEGKVVPPAEELLSPCTKQPCLAYEVKIERLYEKTETTQDGTKTVKGSETLETVKGGAVFGLDDGSGVMMIDVSKGADFDNFKDGYKKELNGHSGSSHIQFGELTFDVPVIGSDKGWTTGFKATEKFVPVEGNLFVLGKLEGASLVKPGWRSMMTSSKGREGLLGSIQKKKKFSFIGGGVAAVISIPLMIFAPAADPNAVSAYCESALTDGRARCSATVSDLDGQKYTWTVTKPGKYELSVFAPKKKISLDPQLVVTDAAGEELANEIGATGGTAATTLDLKAGTYDVTVRPGDGYMVKGGFSFDLQIKSLTPAPVAAPKTAKAQKAAPKAVVVEAPKVEVPAVEEDAAEEASDEVAYTQTELASRVADLNDICGDTYCEGRFNYQFTTLTCADATHCVLAFTAKDSEHAGKLLTSEVEVTGFSSINQDGKEYVYEGSFDEKVGDALGAWEQNPKSKKGGRSAPVAAKKAVEPAPAPVVAKKAEPKPVVVKAEPAPKPVVAPKSVSARPAPVKVTTVAVAPVAAPMPKAVVVSKKSAPVAAPTSTNRTSKNLED